MVTTRSTTNVVGSWRDRSSSVVTATTIPSNNQQKSPPVTIIIMVGGVPAAVSILGAPAIAFTGRVSILGARAPLVVMRPQNQPPPATLPRHLTRQDLVDFIRRQDFMLNDYALRIQRLEAQAEASVVH
ncbi:SLIT and NTRK-like family, member 1 [Sesbania bispinosa]|nr:SLIT and NTRK-like family, member 1 [Sesbania bispinosa]